MDRNEPKAIWMVAGSGPSSMRHASRAIAEQEAKRLARQNPDQWFVVMQAISGHRKSDVESVAIKARGFDDDYDDGRPF